MPQLGEVRTLFAQENDPAFNGYLDKFFASHKYPSVSWIHDVGKGRYDVAGNALLQEADGAGELSAKHVSHRCCTGTTKSLTRLPM